MTFPFNDRDSRRVPDHWLNFGDRASPLTGQSRMAATPGQALLNYLYALLEAEARLACLGVGLDPGLGVLHADVPRRDSLALDIMEPVRPTVDAYVLDLVGRRVFSGRDFYEDRKGMCRILPPLTHHLATSMTTWREALAPVAERVAVDLAKGSAKKLNLSTPLTQQKRRDARQDGRVREGETPRRSLAVPKACVGCGYALNNQDRSYCDACLPERRGGLLQEMLRRSGEAIVGSSRSDESKSKQSATMRRRNREIAEWNLRNTDPVDRESFSREILPLIQKVPVRSLMKATGLSSLYCSQIRRGLKVPHARHWETLRAISELG